MVVDSEVLIQAQGFAGVIELVCVVVGWTIGNNRTHREAHIPGNGLTLLRKLRDSDQTHLEVGVMVNGALGTADRDR